jgi:hypothetical protein
MSNNSAQFVRTVKPQIKQWVFGILGVIGFFYGLMLFGDAFRAYTVPLVVVWVAVPIFACFLRRQNISASFTLSGLRRVQTTLMIVVVALSFSMFADRDHVRNHFGRHFVQGYRYWRAETDLDDSGQPFYVGDQWTATNRSGRWVVELFELLILTGVFVLPAITLKATRSAIYKKETESLFTAEGKRVETYETNA